jgi:tRNA dimethylallyltransferase
MGPQPDQPPLVVIVGETASGKSALALDIALQFGCEIICADSWTVRRGVNIGTAKPTEEERQQVPHHLLDVVDPCENFSAAVFKRLATQAISDIATKGKSSLMVGGTGLYVDSVIYGYSFLPLTDKYLRQELNRLTIGGLLSRIEKLGLSLEGIDVRNKRRLIRLIESQGERPTRQPLRPNTLILGLAPTREVLRERVSVRVDQMIVDGLEQEVRLLSNKYGWECEALKGIGYREWRGYFAGTQDINQTKQRIISATLGLSKRQRTWFKRNADINWICKREDAVDLVTTFLNKETIAKPRSLLQ